MTSLTSLEKKRYSEMLEDICDFVVGEDLDATSEEIRAEKLSCHHRHGYPGDTT